LEESQRFTHNRRVKETNESKASKEKTFDPSDPFDTFETFGSMDDNKTQADKQAEPMIATMHDGSNATKTQAAEDGLLHVIVRAPEKVVFEGPVESMTSKNKRGKFDLLPYHENFISLIEDKLTIREKGKPPQEISVGNAILKISKNQVEVYIGMEAIVTGTPKAVQPPAPQAK